MFIVQYFQAKFVSKNSSLLSKKNQRYVDCVQQNVKTHSWCENVLNLSNKSVGPKWIHKSKKTWLCEK